MLGIIGAMEEEVQEILSLMEIEKEVEDSQYHFYQGRLGQCETVVVQGGIGKVNATISCTLLIRDFNVDRIINIGTAGGLDLKEEVGDIIISDQVVHHDVDLQGFGRPQGQVPGMPQYFEADTIMKNIASEILEENKVRAFTGLIASGDQFVCRQEQVDKILSDFPSAACAEMEAASVAQVCYVFNVPFIITRGLSDIFGKGNNAMQFDEYVRKASKVSAQMCYELAQRLS